MTVTDGRLQIIYFYTIREENIMAMVVKNNMSAINTLNTLNTNSTALSKSLAKGSSGMKINGAADDASGYAISERMRVQIRGLDQANANTQNGSSMMKTAEGAVSSTVDILKTLKEKAISAANDDKTDADRAAIQKELDQSIDQINDNANVTYNGSEQHIRQLCAIFIDNAIKYTDSGYVEVSIGKTDVFARIDVKDTGIGISEEESAKVYQRFYRSSEVASQEGIGIGLYLAREILSDEGGYIKLKSKKGEGTTFSLFLPVN